MGFGDVWPHAVTTEPSRSESEPGKNPACYGLGTGKQPPRLKPHGIEGTAKKSQGVGINGSWSLGRRMETVLL